MHFAFYSCIHCFAKGSSSTLLLFEPCLISAGVEWNKSAKGKIIQQSYNFQLLAFLFAALWSFYASQNVSSIDLCNVEVQFDIDSLYVILRSKSQLVLLVVPC